MDGPLEVEGDTGRELSRVASRALFTPAPSSPVQSWAGG